MCTKYCECRNHGENSVYVFIANPTTQTGTYLPASQLAELTPANTEQCFTYHRLRHAEYVQEKDYSPGFELAKQNNNVIMLRTFLENIVNVGGIRLGWGYFPKKKKLLIF